MITSLNANVKDILGNVEVTNLLRFVELVNVHGGFIAGGFALKLARRALGLLNEHNRIDVIHAYENDIDIWFESATARRSFEAALSIDERQFNKETYNLDVPPRAVSCSAFNAKFLHRTNNTRVQIIEFDRTVNDTLASFDFANCMVAIKDGKFLVRDVEKWIENERSMLLSFNYVTETSIQRILKYTRSYGYKIHPNDHWELVKRLTRTDGNITWNLKQFEQSFSVKQLFEFVSMTPYEQKSNVLSEVMKIAKSRNQQFHA